MATDKTTLENGSWFAILRAVDFWGRLRVLWRDAPNCFVEERGVSGEGLHSCSRRETRSLGTYPSHCSVTASSLRLS